MLLPAQGHDDDHQIQNQRHAAEERRRLDLPTVAGDQHQHRHGEQGEFVDRGKMDRRCGDEPVIDDGGHQGHRRQQAAQPQAHADQVAGGPARFPEPAHVAGQHQEQTDGHAEDFQLLPHRQVDQHVEGQERDPRQGDRRGDVQSPPQAVGRQRHGSEGRQRRDRQRPQIAPLVAAGRDVVQPLQDGGQRGDQQDGVAHLKRRQPAAARGQALDSRRAVVDLDAFDPQHAAEDQAGRPQHGVQHGVVRTGDTEVAQELPQRAASCRGGEIHVDAAAAEDARQRVEQRGFRKHQPQDEIVRRFPHGLDHPLDDLQGGDQDVEQDHGRGRMCHPPQRPFHRVSAPQAGGDQVQDRHQHQPGSLLGPQPHLQHAQHPGRREQQRASTAEQVHRRPARRGRLEQPRRHPIADRHQEHDHDKRRAGFVSPPQFGQDRARGADVQPHAHQDRQRAQDHCQGRQNAADSLVGLGPEDLHEIDAQSGQGQDGDPALGLQPAAGDGGFRHHQAKCAQAGVDAHAPHDQIRVQIGVDADQPQTAGQQIVLRQPVPLPRDPQKRLAPRRLGQPADDLGPQQDQQPGADLGMPRPEERQPEPLAGEGLAVRGKRPLDVD